LTISLDQVSILVEILDRERSVPIKFFPLLLLLKSSRTKCGFGARRAYNNATVENVKAQLSHKDGKLTEQTVEKQTQATTVQVSGVKFAMSAQHAVHAMTRCQSA
jgi:hypothetical protein